MRRKVGKRKRRTMDSASEGRARITKRKRNDKKRRRRWS